MARCKWLGHHPPARGHQQSQAPPRQQAVRTFKCPRSCGSSSSRSGCTLALTDNASHTLPGADLHMSSTAAQGFILINACKNQLYVADSHRSCMTN